MVTTHNSSKLAPQTNPNDASDSEIMSAEPPSYEEATSSKPVTNFLPTAPDYNDDSQSENPAISYSDREPIIQQTIVRQPVVNSTERSKVSFGPNPIEVICPKCGMQDMSQVSEEISKSSLVCCCILCLIGFSIAIFLAASDINSNNNHLDCCIHCHRPSDDNCCMKTNHYCKNCNQLLGSYSK